MKINVIFVGGSCDGKMALVVMEKFNIGMQIPYKGEYYTIQDGPAAKVFQDDQCGGPNLAVRAVFEGTQPAELS